MLVKGTPAWDKQRCTKSVFTRGTMMHYHRCTRAGVAKHEGKWYCKQHHPQLRKETEAKAAHCQYVYENSDDKCSRRVSGGEKYCTMHKHSVVMDRIYAKAQGYDAVEAYLKQVIKDYVNPFPVDSQKVLAHLTHYTRRLKNK